MVDFSGWEMPINYGSQIEEHHAVRRSAGMFDVSHMTVVDVTGRGAAGFLRRLLANDVSRLKEPGMALYSCMLNEEGGIIDDLICYFLEPGRYRLIVNAATREKDLAWMAAVARDHDVELDEVTSAMIAVQGPDARERFCALLDANEGQKAMALAPFSAAPIGEAFVARTGYTGEDGFEVLLDPSIAPELWDRLTVNGVAPCGLGARDTLRLEAGMNLYGQDMDESVTPLDSGLSWTIGWGEGRDFIGRAALEQLRESGAAKRFVGLVLEERAVMRPGQSVKTASGDGVVTSGSFSPTLARPIALARIPAGDDGTAEVEVRGKWFEARVVKPPFVRRGKACDGIV